MDPRIEQDGWMSKSCKHSWFRFFVVVTWVVMYTGIFACLAAFITSCGTDYGYDGLTDVEKGTNADGVVNSVEEYTDTLTASFKANYLFAQTGVHVGVGLGAVIGCTFGIMRIWWRIPLHIIGWWQWNDGYYGKLATGEDIAFSNRHTSRKFDKIFSSWEEQAREKPQYAEDYLKVKTKVNGESKEIELHGSGFGAMERQEKIEFRCPRFIKTFLEKACGLVGYKKEQNWFKTRYMSIFWFYGFIVTMVAGIFLGSYFGPLSAPLAMALVSCVGVLSMTILGFQHSQFGQMDNDDVKQIETAYNNQGQWKTTEESYENHRHERKVCSVVVRPGKDDRRRLALLQDLVETINYN